MTGYNDEQVIGENTLDGVGRFVFTDMLQGVLTMTEAAEALGISRQRVHQLIQAGNLTARKVGSTWLIDRASVEERRERLREHKDTD